MEILDCPRCDQCLQPGEFGSLCTKCQGCWLDYEQFGRSLAVDQDVLEKSDLGPTLQADTSVPEMDRYLKCPRCLVRMKRQRYLLVSGVVIDSCRQHGLWLDDGELTRIRQFLQGSEQPKALTEETLRSLLRG